MKTVLLLAGTAEARDLAANFDSHGVRLIASLSGATAKPLQYLCSVRTGGFGGARGLMDFIARQEVTAVVDATHPFARNISDNAGIACKASSTPLLALVRKAWAPVGDWNSFSTLDEAIGALPTGARILATTGRKEIVPFKARPDIHVFLRSVDMPDDLPPFIKPIVARGPFTLEAESEFMRAHGITHVLTRNAGGDSRARIDAAVSLGIPLHIIERPVQRAANSVSNVADALEWLSSVLRD